MTPLLAKSAPAIVAAALLWPAPASALVDLPCGPLSKTIVDPNTGRQRCADLSPEVLEVLQRSRQLRQSSRQLQQQQERLSRRFQLQQELRDRALADEQRQRDRDLATQQQQFGFQQSLVDENERAKQRLNLELRTRELRTRPLAVEQRQRALGLAAQQQQLEYQQSQIEESERAKQQQLSRDLRVQSLQSALSLEQSITLDQNVNRRESENARRRALLSAIELERRQNVLQQRANLPAEELQTEVRARHRLLEETQARARFRQLEDSEVRTRYQPSVKQQP